MNSCIAKTTAAIVCKRTVCVLNFLSGQNDLLTLPDLISFNCLASAMIHFFLASEPSEFEQNF